MKQIHLFIKGFVIFLKGATFSDFIETRLSNYKPLAIRIRFPLFWRIYFQLGSNLIKKCGCNVPTRRKMIIILTLSKPQICLLLTIMLGHSFTFGIALV